MIRQKPKSPSTVQQAQNSIDKLLLSGSIEEVTERILSTSANAGGDLSAETITSQFRNLPSAENSKHTPGGGGLFDTVGVKRAPFTTNGKHWSILKLRTS